MELKVKDVTLPGLETVQMRFLTAEQAQFFPLNLSRMTGIEPTGDWKSPE
jgi:hypothetical protein